MTNVQLSLAKDAEFENLVVKHQATFVFGAFNKLSAGLVDAEEANFNTLIVQSLNQSNSVGNPFAGITLSPNELVALTSTKTLTTYPYSAADSENTAIQRSATNGVVADILGVQAQSNQLVLGTGNTITINSVANGVSGGIVFGSTVPAAQLVLSGPSSVVNSQSGQTQIVINQGDNPNVCQLQTLLNVAAGQTSGLQFAQSGTVGWTVAVKDLGAPLCQMDFIPGTFGGTPLLAISIGQQASGAIALQSGNLLPSAAASYSLGLTSSHWAQLYLTSQVLTGISTTANFTTNPASGLGTTTSSSMAAQSAATITFTNTNKTASSPALVACSAYSGTTGIPMFQYSNAAGNVVLINASTSAALNGTATFSFVLPNSLGTG